MGQRNGVMLTGANAKIIVNGLTLAFATDINYNISVRHANPKVLGMYETIEFVPLAYDVTGSFTIIRYVKDAVHVANGGPIGAKGSGNGIGEWTKDLGATAAAAAAAATGVPAGQGSDEGSTHRSFVPRSLNIGHHFDIEVRQFVPVVNSGNPPSPPGQGGNNNTSIPDPFGAAADLADQVGSTPMGMGVGGLPSAVQDALGDSLPIPEGQCGVVKLRNCRITDSSFTLSKRSVARQTFQFMARYADEDSFSADKSGVGQDLE